MDYNELLEVFEDEKVIVLDYNKTTENQEETVRCNFGITITTNWKNAERIDEKLDDIFSLEEAN